MEAVIAKEGAASAREETRTSIYDPTVAKTSPPPTMGVSVEKKEAAAVSKETAHREEIFFGKVD